MIASAPGKLHLAGEYAVLDGAEAVVAAIDRRVIARADGAASEPSPFLAAVADALAARGVPFVFLTGYDAQVIPDTYAGVPRSEKPVSTALLARTLLKAGMR